jgi:serine protease Do
LSHTVTAGIVSAKGRTSILDGDTPYQDFIQTDAAINPGNSGGPLLNLDGQVIGMNTAMAMGAENIGFAIPINDIENVYDSVKTNGRIVRPWLGVRYSMVDKSVADANNLKEDYGALIVRGENPTDLAVIPGSPADKAGLAENDIILEVNGQKIDSNHPLVNAITGFKPGDEITLRVAHKGEEKDVKITLAEMPD